MIRKKTGVIITVLCMALFASLLPCGGGRGADAAFSVEDAVYDAQDGCYMITKLAAPVSQLILIDGAADFIFTNGFYIEWESSKGLRDATLYEITFAASFQAGIRITQRGASVCGEILAADGPVGMSPAKALTSARVSAEFKRMGDVMALYINGEMHGTYDPGVLSGAGNVSARLSFTNASAEFDSAKIYSAGIASQTAAPSHYTYDRHTKAAVTVTIETAGMHDGAELFKLSQGALTKAPAGSYSVAHQEIAGGYNYTVTAASDLFPGNEGDGAFFAVRLGGTDYWFSVETADSARIEIESHIEYSATGVDLVVPAVTKGIGSLVIKRENEPLTEAQGGINENAVILRGEYLLTLGGEARFNLYGKKDSGITVEKTLYITVISAETPVEPEEPGEPEEPQEPVEPEEPAAPESPEEPAAPVVPGEPESPEAPGEPVVPGGTVQPPSKGAPQALDISVPAIIFLSAGGAAAVSAAAVFIIRSKKRSKKGTAD